MSPDEISAASVGRAMVVLYTFGAARADGTPEQVARIRDEAIPLMRGADGTFEAGVRKLFAIMGPGWAPSGKWLARIDALIAEQREAEDAP